MMNVTIENCFIANNRNTTAWHSAGLAINGACSNYVVRYNKFCDIDGSAVFDGINGVAGDLLLNWDIYGNVIWHTGSYGSTLAGVISIWNDVNNHQTAQNWHVYNNTIFNISGWFSIQFLSATTTDVQILNNLIVQNRINNLYVNYGMISFAGGAGNLYDYNYYGLCAFPFAMSNAAHENSIYDGPNCRLSDDPGFPGFLDPANGDFHLKGPITNYTGLTFSSPYNIDPDGNTRGADGVWDRGAYEFINRPLLSIASLGTNVLISWPTNNSGYTLEFTSTLNTPAWTNAVGMPVINGNQFIVTNNAVATNTFYRLRSP